METDRGLKREAILVAAGFLEVSVQPLHQADNGQEPVAVNRLSTEPMMRPTWVSINKVLMRMGILWINPSSCCSSASPRECSSQAPSWSSRLCNFRIAQLNLKAVSVHVSYLAYQTPTVGKSCLRAQRWRNEHPEGGQVAISCATISSKKTGRWQANHLDRWLKLSGSRS